MYMVVSDGICKGCMKGINELGFDFNIVCLILIIDYLILVLYEILKRRI